MFAIKFKWRIFLVRRKFLKTRLKPSSGDTKNGLLVIGSILNRQKLLGVQLDYCDRYIDQFLRVGYLSPDMVSHLLVLKTRRPKDGNN